MNYLACFSICSFFLFSCKPINQKKTIDSSIPKYDLVTHFELDKSLQEISGLSFANNKLYANNDEQGHIFTINPLTGKIEQELKFGKKDDYEGIETINKNEVVIINSKADLSIYNLETKQVNFVKNKIDAKHNVEGICKLDTNNLLLAFKGEMLDNKRGKGIYKFNLANKKIDRAPFLVINVETLSEKSVKELFYKERIKKFSPSGIAIHPTTKQIFIVSARGSTLAIFNKEKQLETITLLDEELLPQPEGICFDPMNNLYISSEAKENEGHIVKYSYKY